MARTIEEIKESMLQAYAGNEIIKKKYYDLVDGDKLEFSKVSLENILFYVIATALWTVEVLFDRHKQEVVDYIDQMKPHSLRWYVSKAKMFRFGDGLAKTYEESLIEGTDRYPDTGSDGNPLTEEYIEDKQLVKFAAANEFGKTNDFDGQPASAMSNSDGVVYLKVAKKKGTGESVSAGSANLDTDKSPLSAGELEAFTAYINEVKDAGVMVRIINEPANLLCLKLDVYVNPMVLNSTTGKLRDGDGEPVLEAIKSYISNLPFNGEYRNADLIDALQKIDGVVIPELKSAEESYDGIQFHSINAKATPHSGYYAYFVDENDEEKSSKITYKPYTNNQ